MSWLLGTISTARTFSTGIGSALADAGLAGAVADDLRDDELLELLGRAAKAVYDLRDIKGDGIERTDIWGDMTGSDGRNGCGSVQYGLYEITKGHHTGKTILAFRGTNLKNPQQVLQGLSMITQGPHISQAVREAFGIAEENRPNFLTGHCLGGFLAECVCSHTGIPGASFAAPGPIGQVTENRLTGQKFGGVRWKTVINRNDCIATTIGGIGGSQSSHIVRSNNILWLDFDGDPLTKHSMEEYINHL